MKIMLMDRTKKKKFFEELGYLGKFKSNLLLMKTGLEKIRAYSGSLTNEEVMEIWRLLPIEGAGLYFGKEVTDKHGRKEVRLSLDALHVLKDQIKENVLILEGGDVKSWFLGKDINLQDYNLDEKLIGSFVAVSNGKDFIGTGKISKDKILYSYLPKERRIKENG